MPAYCSEAAHFFLCVYVTLLSLTSIYLSIGFPCDPYADLKWDPIKNIPIDHSFQQLLRTHKRTCWLDCQSYTMRLYFLHHPKLIYEKSNPNNTFPIFYLIRSLVESTQPNPFCYSKFLQDLLKIDEINPFCSTPTISSNSQKSSSPIESSQEENLTGNQMKFNEFQRIKREQVQLHGIVLIILCLDCLLVIISIILIYIAPMPNYEIYILAFGIAMITHVLSLFLASHVAKNLTCVDAYGKKFCDAMEEEIVDSFEERRHFDLPSKSEGAHNFEMSLVVKNINTVCLILVGLFYFIKWRTLELVPLRNRIEFEEHGLNDRNEDHVEEDQDVIQREDEQIIQ